MSYKGLPEQLVARINPVDARVYAVASGWRRLSSVNGRVAVFSHPASDLDQLIIPLDSGIPDYARRMAEVVANLAERENRPAAEILDDLLLPPSDVLRFRLDEPQSQSGLLPLDQGIGLLAGARRALLASACSTIQPRTFHPRLSRTEAEQLVKASFLGQSERGSYTVVISCRLDAVGPGSHVPRPTPLFEALSEHPPEPAPPSEIPFTRRVTSLLMRSVARLASALDSDQFDDLMVADGSEPPLSANLCEALLMMQPIGERSRLSLATTWSRSLPPPVDATPPSLVHLRGEYFPTIAALAMSLRPNPEPQVSHFVGLVDSLHGDPDEHGHVSGEVQLLILNQEELTKARVILGTEDYHKAWEAHGVGGYVSLSGILVRGERVHRITEISNFKFLRD